jgi:hypothetical protein
MKKVLSLVLVLVLLVTLLGCSSKGEYVKVYGVDEVAHEVVLVSNFEYKGKLEKSGNYVVIDGIEYELYHYWDELETYHSDFSRIQYVIRKG